MLGECAWVLGDWVCRYWVSVCVGLGECARVLGECVWVLGECACRYWVSVCVGIG